MEENVDHLKSFEMFCDWNLLLKSSEIGNIYLVYEDVNIIHCIFLINVIEIKSRQMN